MRIDPEGFTQIRHYEQAFLQDKVVVYDKSGNKAIYYLMLYSGKFLLQLLFSINRFIFSFFSCFRLDVTYFISWIAANALAAIPFIMQYCVTYKVMNHLFQPLTGTLDFCNPQHLGGGLFSIVSKRDRFYGTALIFYEPSCINHHQICFSLKQISVFVGNMPNIKCRKRYWVF